MQHFPTAIQLIGDDQLQITWNDGAKHLLRLRMLRDHCPCATCREKRRAELESPTQFSSRTELPVLSLAETQPLRIVSMQPVGNYAYGIAFSDGHDTGIFSLELLRELGERATTDSGS
jgi:DUF971 family protein